MNATAAKVAKTLTGPMKWMLQSADETGHVAAEMAQLRGLIRRGLVIQKTAYTGQLTDLGREVRDLL